MLPCMARSELFEESFSFGDFGCVLCCAFVGRVMKQIQRFAWSRGTFADIRSFEDIFKVLSLRPTFQRTSTPQKHQAFLSRCEGYLAMRTHSAFLNIQYPSDLVISGLGIFSFEDDQNQVRHRTEYCFGVSLLSSVPSMAHCCW